MKWPQEAKVTQKVASSADTIRKGFKEAFDANAIVTAWDESHPNKDVMTPQMAREWSMTHVHAKRKPLELAITRTYANGWSLGDSIARSRLLGMSIGKSITAGVVDWSTWTPGMSSAAALVNPPNGLQALIDADRVTIANDIIRTKMDRIGTSLATALQNGYDATKTAALINTVINDPQHAMVIARTEMNRAMSLATRDRYESANVEQVEWLVAEGCEDCQENADASPLPIDEAFPTGDFEPPAHPNCMCALAPYFDDSDLPTADDVTDGEFSGEDVAAESDYSNLEPIETADDVMDSMNQQRNEGFKANEQQVNAIAEYTSGTGMYGEVNGYLRDGGFDQYTGAIKQQQVFEIIKQLDSVIMEAPALRETTLSYRGIWGQDQVRFFTSMEPGTQFTDAGFVSTSLNPQIAKNFARYDKANGGVLLEIVNPAGTKGIFPLALRTEVTPQYVTSVSENEWLLPKNSTFEVLSVEGRTVKVVVK